MSRRSSRPSSAASYSGRSSGIDGEHKLECKAAYLSIFDDIRDEITSREDFILVLQQSGRNPSKRMLDKYWNEHTDSMSFDEFVDICRKEPATSADDLMKAFRKIDINGDGYISLEELYKTLTTKGERMSQDEVRAMIDEVDENKDGRLDYGEFCNMLVSTTEECKKMSMKIMVKKERRKQKKLRSEGSNLTPRRDGEDEIRGSRTSILSSASQRNDPPWPSPRGRKDSKVKAPVASKSSRLPEPQNLREWTHCGSKGVFFLDSDEGEIVSHQYLLDLPDDSNVWITIHPVKIGEAGSSSDGSPIDTMLYVFRVDGKGERLVTFTEQRDSRGKYCVRCDLSAGKYKLIPFTTGCRFKSRVHDPKQEAKLVKKDKDDKIVLTKAFKKALEEIFEMADLDGSRSLSREEFTWFNMRTSGEEVADDEWQVVEENVELVDHEITKNGFIRLNEMEAEDNEGETDDLWITLTSMGFSKNLTLDEACPFKLDVHTDNCDDAELRVTALEAPSSAAEDAIAESVIAKGKATSVKNMKDLFIHTYIGSARASIVVENKSRTRVQVQVDCSGSRNCISNRGDLDYTMTVPAGTSVVGHHLVPKDERSEWLVRCVESILK